MYRLGSARPAPLARLSQVQDLPSLPSCPARPCIVLHILSYLAWWFSAVHQGLSICEFQYIIVYMRWLLSFGSLWSNYELCSRLCIVVYVWRPSRFFFVS